LADASAADVKALLEQVSDIVFEKSGIRLEPEVRIW
jgi:UDP-N-acetylenolpyruvoylglucosamine reductase